MISISEAGQGSDCDDLSRANGLSSSVSISDLVRRVFDIFGACVGILIAAPIVAILLVIVGLDGRSPFFVHQRVGRRGRLFGVLKIRTMYADAAERLDVLLKNDPNARQQWIEHRKLSPDPRITPIGRILRASSLDELPQLWNVLRGDMSLVGPRPVPDDELELYGSSARFYLRVKPGMTGLWQVSGRNATSYSRRVAMDRIYVQRRSLVQDVFIIVGTVREVVCGGGQ